MLLLLLLLITLDDSVDDDDVVGNDDVEVEDNEDDDVFVVFVFEVLLLVCKNVDDNFEISFFGKGLTNIWSLLEDLVLSSLEKSKNRFYIEVHVTRMTVKQKQKTIRRNKTWK